MTTTELTTNPTDTWSEAMAALKGCYPHVREPILAALNIFLKQVVVKLQARRAAEAERLRDAMRKAVAMLTPAIA